MTKRIVLTGGGTAGHVTANIALIPKLRKEGFEIFYIGSYDGMEKGLIEKENIPYTGISTGKLRRYMSVKNFSDPFRVIKGLFEAMSALRKIKPSIVFSKGGFVSVPVVWAAFLCGIPAVIHESDMTPGLANKLCQKPARKICLTFPETMSKVPDGKGVLTGSPIREELLHGNRERGLGITGFDGIKPVLMVIGGSLGSVAVNNAVRENIDSLLEGFDIIHVCGKNNLDEKLVRKGYRQFEYVQEELKDLYCLADLVISRAGATVISELLSLKKPNILIPLPLDASRGDQILNAESFRKQGFSLVLDQKEIEKNGQLLTEAVAEVFKNRDMYIKNMEAFTGKDSVSAVTEILMENLKK